MSSSLDQDNNILQNNIEVDTADVHICIGPSDCDETQRNTLEYDKTTQKDSLFLFSTDEEEFFNKCFEINQFLKQYQENIGNSSFLNYLAIADDLFINKNHYDKAIEIYQRLLSTIDIKEYEEVKHFKTNFIIKKYDLPNQFDNMIISQESEKNEIIALIKIKILHCIQYYYYKKQQYQQQDSIINKIIALNKKDYYAMFASAYIKYKGNKYPECFQLLHSSLLDCLNEEYKNYLKHFLNIINNMELS